MSPRPPRPPMITCPHCGKANDPTRGSNLCFSCRQPLTGSLIRAKVAAVYLDRSPNTLANWRVQGRGPAWVGSGSGLRYRISDLDAWIAENTRTATR